MCDKNDSACIFYRRCFVFVVLYKVKAEGDVNIFALGKVSHGECDLIVINFNDIADILADSAEIVALGVGRKIDAVNALGKLAYGFFIISVVEMTVDENNVFVTCKDISYLIGLIAEVARFPYVGKTMGVFQRLMADNESRKILGFGFCKLIIKELKLGVGKIGSFEFLLFRTENDEYAAVHLVGVIRLTLGIDVKKLVHLVGDQLVVLFIEITGIMIACGKNDLVKSVLVVKDIEKSLVFAAETVVGKIAGNDERIKVNTAVFHVIENI